MTDKATAEVMRICRAAGVTIHIRGDDRRPVIETRCRLSRRVVGGKELRQRIADAKISIDLEALHDE